MAGEVAILMVMKCVCTLIPHCELWGSGSHSLSQREAAAAGPASWAPCLCVLQLGASQVLNGRAGHMKQGKSAALFIDDTLYKQQVIICSALYLLGSLSAKAGHMDPRRGQLYLESTQQEENCKHH